MNMRRVPWFVLVFFSLAAVLSACAPAATPVPRTEVTPSTPTLPLQPTNTPLPPTPSPAPPTATVAASVADFPLTITDDLGREVTLLAVPMRIISLAPSNTEVLFAVGAGSSVVGVTKYCDYPSEAQQVAKIGGFSAKTISVETIVALKPDLVLAARAQSTVVEALEQAGIPVVAFAPESFENVYANIELVGRITAHSQEATQIVQQMKTRVAAVTAKVNTIPNDKRLTVFWETFDAPLMTASPSTFIGQMIELAGGINIFAELAEEYPQISAEEVISRNPAVILGPDSHGDKLTPEQVAARPGWDQLDAVKNHRVYLIDGNTASRPGPRLVEALEAIARALYPDVFEG